MRTICNPCCLNKRGYKSRMVSESFWGKTFYLLTQIFKTICNFFEPIFPSLLKWRREYVPKCCDGQGTQHRNQRNCGSRGIQRDIHLVRFGITIR